VKDKPLLSGMMMGSSSLLWLDGVVFAVLGSRTLSAKEDGDCIAKGSSDAL
jgi:hypothetical protein